MPTVAESHFKKISDYKHMIGTFENVNELAIMVSDRIQLDMVALQSGKPISDFAIAAPSINSSQDKKTAVAKKAATHYRQKALKLENRPPNPDPIIETQNIYIGWGKALSALRNHIRKRLKEETTKENEKMASFQRLCSPDPLISHMEWVYLKQKKKNWISEEVVNPKPEPTEFVKPDELLPLLSFLSVFEDNKDNNNKYANVFQDGRLDLCKRGVGPAGVSNVIDAMKHFGPVRHLLLGNNCSGSNGSKAIKQYLLDQQSGKNNAPKIETWYLGGNHFIVNNIQDLLIGLSNDKFATSLWLKRNPIGAGAFYIWHLLQVNQTLRVLDLDNTGLLDDGVSKVMEGAKYNTGLEYLYLNSNGITPTGASYIADYFRFKALQNKTRRPDGWFPWCWSFVKSIWNFIFRISPPKQSGLKGLWLGVNRIDNEGVIELVDAISTYPRLEKLCLSSNSFDAVAANAIRDKLSGHKGLLYLGIGFNKATYELGELTNYIGDEGAFPIAEFLARTPQLEILDVNFNGIQRTGLLQLRRVILKHKNLVHFRQTRVEDQIDIMDDINQHLEENCQRKYGITHSEFVKSRIYRELNHHPYITHIDSTTRNK
jgi:Ran GTPase-activating protein (RanGAP) involved in mRNA processing and transport